jgi:hypothetical protein
MVMLTARFLTRLSDGVLKDFHECRQRPRSAILDKRGFLKRTSNLGGRLMSQAARSLIPLDKAEHP